MANNQSSEHNKGTAAEPVIEDLLDEDLDQVTGGWQRI